jgi:hypothetical protein
LVLPFSAFAPPFVALFDSPLRADVHHCCACAAGNGVCVHKMRWVDCTAIDVHAEQVGTITESGADLAIAIGMVSGRIGGGIGHVPTTLFPTPSVTGNSHVA